MAALNLIKNGSFAMLQLNTIRSVAAILGIFHRKSTNVDVVDIFTTDLLKKKKFLPSAAKTKTSIINAEKTQFLKKITSQQLDQEAKPALDIQKWYQNDLDNYLTIAIDCDDRKTFEGIIDQIFETKLLPSDAIILQSLRYMCDDSGNSMANISKLIDVCKQKNLPFYAKNLEFAPFLAQYLWGLEKFDDALNTLDGSYCTKNQNTKATVQQNYRQIIYDAINKENEEVVSNIVVRAKQIYCKHNDPTMIFYIWGDCFFSELFRNRQIANELFLQFDALRTVVGLDIGRISFSLLQQHNLDAIHRLIEQCLAFEMKNECYVCLTALFDYQYWRNDLRACSEIMTNSLQLNIPLSNTHNQKLVNLLLNKKPMPQKQPTKKILSTRFKFKF